MKHLFKLLTLLASLLFPSAEGDAAKVFGPMVRAAVVFSLTIQNGGASAVSGATTTTVDFGTMTWAPGATRIVAAILYSQNSSVTTTITGITVNGSSLSQVSGAANTGHGAAALACDIWESTGSISGTSGDVQVTFSATPNPFGSHSTIALYNLTTTTPGAATADNANTTFGTSVALSSFSVPSGGGAIVITGGQNGATLSSLTNTATDASTDNQYYTHATSTGSLTFTATYASSDGIVMGAAAWGP